MAPDAVGYWFRKAVGTPTGAQRLAWPRIERGENLLLTAPTGTGKTLAAFVPIFKSLGENPPNGLACLYVAPLKALARDAAKNLRRQLRSLRVHAAGFSEIRVGLRTGDSSARSRRALLRNPPHILVTTPESLAILLTQALWCDLFSTLRWVVVDELHAVVGSKRGADLALSLERLETLIAEKRTDGAEVSQDTCYARSLHRIGLSATCAPLQPLAQFLAGTGRQCSIAQVGDSAPMELVVEPLRSRHAPCAVALAADDTRSVPASFIASVVERLEPELLRNRTILVFANVRSITERLTWALRRRFPKWAGEIAAHHSSLAVETRRHIERRLKCGKMRVVVTSTSLELGIDIGSVDSVVFVHPPGGVARALQRLGRSGHGPGRLRRGLFLTAGPAELLEATVTAASATAGQLERMTIINQPVDVLCQHLVGMAMTGWHDPGEVLALVRRAYPYREVSDDDFGSCLAYLSGRHPDGRDWLPSRLRWMGSTPSSVQNTAWVWSAGRFSIINQKIAGLLRRNLGSIVSDEPREVRLLRAAHEVSGGFGVQLNSCPALSECAAPSESLPIGSLDEAYADRLRPGDRFLLDGRALEFRRFEDSAVLVQESLGRPTVPQWASGAIHLAPELARRLFLFREEAADALHDGPSALATYLHDEYALSGSAVAELTNFLALQEMVSEIPRADCLLIECVANDGSTEYAFHTPLPRTANDALARVLSSRLADALGVETQTAATDLGFLLTVPIRRAIASDKWQYFLRADNFHADLDAALHDCQTLRDRFARVAMIGLMVLRQPLGGRRKVGGRDWAQRRLFDQVRRADPDFIMLRQAEHEMLSEVCDATSAVQYLEALPRMHIRWRPLMQRSPFAAAWTQQEAICVEAIEQPAEVLARLHRDLTKPAITRYAS